MITGVMGSMSEDASPDPGDTPENARDEHDPMAPPQEPCECFCLHCRRTFNSDQMWFQKVLNASDGFPGFWMCPTPNCSGAGFTMDIFPTDPDHPANDGWYSDDSEEEESEEGDWEVDEPDDDGAEAEWDPKEPGYAWMDEADADEDDLEGEEWKYGLAPGEVPPAEPRSGAVESRDWREEEGLYDAPDRRPREIDWKNVERHKPSTDAGDEDIPF